MLGKRGAIIVFATIFGQSINQLVPGGFPYAPHPNADNTKLSCPNSIPIFNWRDKNK